MVSIYDTTKTDPDETSARLKRQYDRSFYLSIGLQIVRGLGLLIIWAVVAFDFHHFDEQPTWARFAWIIPFWLLVIATELARAKCRKARAAWLNDTPFKRMLRRLAALGYPDTP